jgi:phosphocarrier protein FPr
VVGIVVVAHSSQLAEGVIALAKNMLREQIPLAAAAGIDDEEQPFGTDAASIVRAIESVFSNDGVVVLMDMGSALLSAETALDFLSLEKRSRVRLCEAPLVEGAIAAAIRAEGGGTLVEVIDEARGALRAKASQLVLETEWDRDAEYGIEKSQVKPPTVREIRVTVRNRLGLHARPAARFVTTASHFQSEITVRNITKKSQSVSAKSINLLTTLGVEQGDEISITASGPDASDALGILSSLIKKGFGEAATPDQYALETKGMAGPRSIDGELSGTGASPGIAIGPSVLYQPVIQEVPQKQVQNAQEEWQRLTDAVQIVRDDIRSLRNRVMGQTENGAAIFDAHILSLR